ncbi:MAG: hydroxysqualene dehydroxylase HpnE [Melioribacteraceae bacterium]|nr:hydroxysqualene dehydroxylase HpnE [Melioribacteraceae bacterium]MCF8354615.1 hydroxysqualene dehydroxylase HpnE [Melioribacteraceae bacterium]MCF8395003.1 hydroxysqualene dehydroxylase HpnE [Melioribacteraceae bacterium]MCF8418893.1 hydroxysqualene dehydroxylase HpnE [Melioribacteraceae bacterium]
MKKIIIIGGGFAGITSAVYLSSKGHKVNLIESSPKLGGRAYSFKSKNETVVDNGQHILMGCYEETLKLLQVIGAEDKIKIQPYLEVEFAEQGGRQFELNAGSKFYPFNLLYSLIKFRAIQFIDRLKVIIFFTRLFFVKTEKLEGKSVKNWLKANNQNENICNALWDFLVIGTLNCNPSEADASVFADVLKKIFFKGNKASVIVIPDVGLSEMYVDKSIEYIKNNDGKISTSEKVIELKRSTNGKINEVITTNSTYTDFDYVISAVPPFALNRIKGAPDNLYDLCDSFEYSPILTVHIWLKSNPFKGDFCGMINSQIHWIFNRGTHITLITSAANKLINLSDDDLIERFCSELEKYFPIFYKELVEDFLVIREKRATFIPTTQITKFRKNIKSVNNNFILAGDWVNTGLPSTIEGAVKSGKIASEKI